MRLHTLLFAAALALALPASALAARSTEEMEAANARLVRDFLARASTRLDHMRDFLTTDVTFQYEANRVAGRDALIARAAEQMAAADSYAMELSRLSVVGDTVLNERFDVATMKNGQKVRFKVTSVFLIRDGKIAEWREYPQPSGN